jgi:hypothetical protein
LSIIGGRAGGQNRDQQRKKESMEGSFHRLSDDTAKSLFKAMIHGQGLGRDSREFMNR